MRKRFWMAMLAFTIAAGGALPGAGTARLHMKVGELTGDYSRCDTLATPDVWGACRDKSGRD